MTFKYSKRQKQLAQNVDRSELKKAYEISERNLNKAALKGSNKDLNLAMKHHQNIEYALLYQQSPEFKKKIFKEFKNLKEGEAINFSKNSKGEIKAQNVSVVEFKEPIGKVAYGIWGQDEKPVDYYQKTPNKRVKPFYKK